VAEKLAVQLAGKVGAAPAVRARCLQRGGVHRGEQGRPMA